MTGRLLIVAMLALLSSCRFLMTGPTVKNSEILYYGHPPSLTNNCHLQFDGVYVTTSSEPNVYYLLRFREDGSLANGLSPMEKLEFSRTKGIANNGVSFYWSNCDSVKYHTKTHYGYEEFGSGVIEPNGSLLLKCDIFNFGHYHSTEVRTYTFYPFEP